MVGTKAYNVNDSDGVGNVQSAKDWVRTLSEADLAELRNLLSLRAQDLVSFSKDLGGYSVRAVGRSSDIPSSTVAEIANGRSATEEQISSLRDFTLFDEQ